MNASNASALSNLVLEWRVGDQITIVSLFQVEILLVGISLITKYRTSVLTACRSDILIFIFFEFWTYYLHIGSLEILPLGASVYALLTCHIVMRSESSDVSFHV